MKDINNHMPHAPNFENAAKETHGYYFFQVSKQNIPLRGCVPDIALPPKTGYMQSHSESCFISTGP